MASAASEPRTVHGRLDATGRLIEADPELQELQREAGAELGQTLALPQIAAVAQLARKLGTSVGRPAIAASGSSDIGLWVNATPEGDEIALTLEGWTVRAAGGPQLASVIGRGAEVTNATADVEWATDEELRIISLSSEFADLLAIDLAEAIGAPLTKVLRLDEDERGEMPLISALALRRSFDNQRGRSRMDESRKVSLTGEVVTASDGSFAGFRGIARSERANTGSSRSLGFDHGLDAVLRSPLDRIIDNAEQIVARADGPLRSDYASYGTDIASAARHLLSVLQATSEDPAHAQDVVDLAALAAEAVIMLESSAEERGIHIDLDRPEPLRAYGQERAVIQILVNLIVNAVRYSPEGGAVRLSFVRTPGAASVTVADEGRGIAAGDEQRIFERFERAHTKESGTGLGLAISRRLARSMGGDVTLDSAPGEGARFTLTLPAA